MISGRQHACSQAECKVGETGTCLEGLVPEECSHHEWTSEEQPEEEQGNGADAEQSETEVVETLMRDFHHGEALTLAEAGVITASGPSRLVVLAGDQKCGKTTLLTSIYEKFLKGPFCDLTFAESLTLPGFEQRAFQARMDSGRDRADTPRTNLPEGLKVLHLCLVAEDPEPRRVHALFGDLSGERYRLSRESTADAQELQFLRRTDQLCLLVDGRRLADPRERHGALGEAHGTLRSLLEAQVLGGESQIDLVCSKWDLVHGNGEVVGFVDRGFDKIRVAFEDDVRKFRICRIAARPAQVTAEIPHGFGVGELLKGWMCPKPRIGRIDISLPKAQPDERECARYGRRYPAREVS